VAIFGVSYKAGVGDLRESPTLKIMCLLKKSGADLVYSDEFVPELPDFGLVHQDAEVALSDCDAAVIVTAHGVVP